MLETPRGLLCRSRWAFEAGPIKGGRLSNDCRHGLIFQNGNLRFRLRTIPCRYTLKESIAQDNGAYSLESLARVCELLGPCGETRVFRGCSYLYDDTSNSTAGFMVLCVCVSCSHAEVLGTHASLTMGIIILLLLYFATDCFVLCCAELRVCAASYVSKSGLHREQFARTKLQRRDQIGKTSTCRRL